MNDISSVHLLDKEQDVASQIPLGGAGPMYCTWHFPLSGRVVASVVSQCSQGPSAPGARPSSPALSGASGSTDVFNDSSEARHGEFFGEGSGAYASRGSTCRACRPRKPLVASPATCRMCQSLHTLSQHRSRPSPSPRCKTPRADQGPRCRILKDTALRHPCRIPPSVLESFFSGSARESHSEPSIPCLHSSNTKDARLGARFLFRRSCSPREKTGGKMAPADHHTTRVPWFEWGLEEDGSASLEIWMQN